MLTMQRHTRDTSSVVVHREEEVLKTGMLHFNNREKKSFDFVKYLEPEETEIKMFESRNKVFLVIFC